MSELFTYRIIAGIDFSGWEISLTEELSPIVYRTIKISHVVDLPLTRRLDFSQLVAIHH